MISTSEQTKVSSKKVVSLCSICKHRATCKDYLESIAMSKHGFSVIITDCPNFEEEYK